MKPLEKIYNGLMQMPLFMGYLFFLILGIALAKIFG